MLESYKKTLDFIEPVKGLRHVVLYGYKDPDTIVKVNGVQQNNEDGIVYRFISPSDFFGWYDISITGRVEINRSKCLYYYPHNNAGIWTYQSGEQSRYCEWMYPEEYGYHDDISYKHLIVNGPSYVLTEGVWDYETDLHLKIDQLEDNMKKISDKLNAT